MKVLFAGTAGTCKRMALRNLQRHAESIPHRDTRIVTGSDGEIPVVDHILYDRDPIPFLKLPIQAQKQRWREAFDQILGIFEEDKRAHHFLGLHLTYRYLQIPRCVIDFKKLVDWQPDCIVTLIDDAYCVKDRIHEGGYEDFSLQELLLWRAEEILIGDILAKAINPDKPPPNYVVAVRHPVSMLSRLLFEHKKTVPVYLSYNISETRKERHTRLVIDTYRKKMHEQTNVAAFDPLTIDELAPVAVVEKPPVMNYDTAVPAHRWPTLDPALTLACDDDIRDKGRFPIKLTAAELQELYYPLDAQIKHRDIRLVDQGHFLIVYRPTIHGKAQLSSGVNGEVTHAEHTGCRILWYIKKGEDPLPTSPFSDKRPGADPYFIFEESDERFWQTVQNLKRVPQRDFFLR